MKAFLRILTALVLLLRLVAPCSTNAAGVTIITHGAEGDVTGWVAGIADAIPSYFNARYPGLGTNFSIYTLKLTESNDTYYYQFTRDAGSIPATNQTGEIIVKLDWSQLASINPLNVYVTSTYTIAQLASYVILQTNTLKDLNGHSIAECPIHLVGHSRGGSVMAELSYVLGTNGVWVDHLTTLDPHPLNNDGFDDLFLLPTDAPVRTYSNVLFHDNYYQTEGVPLFDPHGEPVDGAYIRNLNSEVLTGGYATLNTSPSHSNVHLWYYGTISLATPVTLNDDGQMVTIDSTMRNTWWVPYENCGRNAGFVYSLIGGANRMSSASPLGLPEGAEIVSGYNQNWDLGAGTAANRTVLSTNNGTWPNVIKFNITGTNRVLQGSNLISKLYYQYGGSSNLTAQIFLGRDLNPYNTNAVLIKTLQPPATGSSGVNYYGNLGLATTNVQPGIYAVYAKITDGKHTRYLYTPELVEIRAPSTPPTLDIARGNDVQFVIGINGVSSQKVILLSSSDLMTWKPLLTNTLATDRITVTNQLPVTQQFYRAVLSQ